MEGRIPRQDGIARQSDDPLRFLGQVAHGQLTAQPKFSIGIDLGTSNSVLTYSPLSGDDGSKVLAVTQWDTPSTVIDSTTVPSFLYLPEEAIAAQLRGRGLDIGGWIVGRRAQRKASEMPGRVAQSDTREGVRLSASE